MKKSFALLLTLMSFSLMAQPPATTDLNWTPTVKFEKNTHDFGNIPEGPKATYEFNFTNTGKEPIMVNTAQAGCGCTTPEWPKQPIAPGKTGKITVGYNSEGRPGTFSKDVTVTFSSGVNRDKTGTMKLTINGNVNGKGAGSTKTKAAPAEPAKTATPAGTKKGVVNSPVAR
jgi:hypothetical protein